MVNDAASPVVRLSPDERPARSARAAGRSRVALYSHDSTGLGHIRRNLLLAGRLAGDGHDVLLVSGSPEASSMLRPSGTDIVTLPALSKDPHGTYRSRHLSLGLPELHSLRRDILTSALTAFAPDLLVVDRHARGFLGELEPALEHLIDTRVVLGLRDVLDSPERVRREWRDRATAPALAAWYDEVWVYGDGALIPPLETVGVTSPVPIVPVGYLRADRPPPPDREPIVTGPFVLCTVGGGADGAAVAEATLAAGPLDGRDLVIVTGPQMPTTDRQRLLSRVGGRQDVRLVSFVHELPELLRIADAAVVMGGYNTVCELLGSSTPALVIPRQRPRLEQRLRADALAARGLVDMLPEDRVTAAEVRRWLVGAVARPRRHRAGVDLSGLGRLSVRVAALLGDAPTRGRAPRHRDPVPVHPAPEEAGHAAL